MTKLLTVLMLVFFSSACSAQETTEANNEPVAAMSESLNIRLFAGNGWILTIMPDGSGSFSYGSLPFDGATFPSETLNYSEVYSSIVPYLKSAKSDFRLSAVGVVVTKEGQSSHIALYFDGATYWNGLVEKLKSDLTAYNQQRFETISRENPLRIKIVENNLNSVDSLQFEPFKWVDEDTFSADLAEEIKLNMYPAFSGKNAEQEIINKSSVLPYVARSVSMAYPPVSGVKMDGYFLLSGGTSTGAVDDFSSGIAVDAENGKIYLWSIND